MYAVFAALLVLNGTEKVDPNTKASTTMLREGRKTDFTGQHFYSGIEFLGETFMIDVQLQLEPKLSVDEFIDVLNRSSLAERRPVDDVLKITGMLKHADIIATARTSDGLLVGVSRCLTDFHYTTYLSDLAVDADYQRQRIGKRLVEYCHVQAGLHTNLILIAAPAAETYYGKIGMQQHPSCWMIRAKTN